MFEREYRRSRVWLAGGMLVVIAAGLGSRRYPAVMPRALGDYPGDALWSLALYLAIAFIRPDIAIWRLAGTALGASYFVEFLQLYRAHWITTIRSTTLGHMLLGQGFDWIDLWALTVGVCLGATLDVVAAMLARNRRQRSGG